MAVNDKLSEERVAEDNPDLPLSFIRDILIAREEDATEDYVFD